MTKYDNEQLAALCDKFNLLEYVSRDHEVKTIGGRNYILCPCHSENTPSCLIDDKHYYCFGCKSHGSAIDYFINAEHLTYEGSINKLAQLTGSNPGALKSCEALVYFKSVRNAMFPNKQSTPEHCILPPETMLKFADETPSEWVTEGISVPSMKRFGVRIDHGANRIVYPVHDSNGTLINVKGRTRFANYKDLNIPKYLYYYKLGKLDFFEGMLQNKSMILATKRIVIFEGLKSVMKLCDYGDGTGVSSETSHLSDDQVKLLIQLGVNDVTIAYDSDVDMAQIYKEVSALRKFTNVYAIKDSHKLLGDKMAPVDNGCNTWKRLYSERIKL